MNQKDKNNKTRMKHFHWHYLLIICATVHQHSEALTIDAHNNDAVIDVDNKEEISDSSFSDRDVELLSCFLCIETTI